MSDSVNVKELPEAVIFDLDGTLVTSSLDFVLLCKETGCVPGQDILRYVEDLPEHEQSSVKATIHDHEMRDAHSSEVIAGVPETLLKLNNSFIKTGVVTRNSIPASQLKLDRSQLRVGRVLAREHAPPKPSPDALLMLADEWQVDPKHCVYVGDFRYDLEAAHNAGMHAAWYASGYSSQPEWAHLAHFDFSHYDDFIPTLVAYWRKVSAGA